MSSDSGIKTLSLNKPLIDTDKKEIKELVFQEMTVEDFIEFKQTEFIEVKKIIELTSRLTGIDKKVFNKMSPKDYMECSNIIQSFFGFSQETPDK